MSVSISVTVPRHTGWWGGGEGLPFFFWSRGGCQKILYDVGGPGIFKKIAPLKKYPLPLLQQYAY